VSVLLEHFARVRADRGDEPLIFLPSARHHLTAGQLWDDALALSEAFAQAGLGAGSLVALAAGNDPATFVAWVAARMNDVTLLPVDRTTTPRELFDLMAEFGARASIVRAQDAVDGALRVGGVGLAIDPAHGSRTSVSYPGAAALKLTSGTSGRFKAAWTTEAQLIADGRHILQAMEIRPEDVQIVAIPLSHSYGLGAILLPLFLQGTRVVVRETFVPQQVTGDADAYNARVFCGVPFMFDRFIAHPGDRPWPATLTRLIAAGARLDPTTQARFREQFGVSIHSFYGTSETGGICFDSSDDAPDATRVGRPLPGVTVTLRPFPDAEPGVGQVHIRSDAVSVGYVNDDRPDEGFVDGGFLAGDLGRFDEEGRLVLTGRVSNFINVAGRKVQPEEVEQVLRDLPGVIHAVVLGVADEVRGELLVACLVGAARPGVRQVRRHCLARLAPHKVPRAVVWLDALPVTERGKPDLIRLRDVVERDLMNEGWW
jgi:long-chain acyl-CoA synthetase